MRHVCDRLRADSRLSFNFVVGAATPCIVNAARVELSSVWFAFKFQFCWGRHRLHYACGAIATVFGLIRAWVLILFGRHRLHCECGVCATVFGMIRIWVLILLGPPLLAL